MASVGRLKVSLNFPVGVDDDDDDDISMQFAFVASFAQVSPLKCTLIQLTLAANHL